MTTDSGEKPQKSSRLRLVRCVIVVMHRGSMIMEGHGGVVFRGLTVKLCPLVNVRGVCGQDLVAGIVCDGHEGVVNILQVEFGHDCSS